MPKHSHPGEFAAVLTLIFMASQTLDIVLIIQVLRLVTIVSMMDNDFDDTRWYFDDHDNLDDKL